MSTNRTSEAFLALAERRSIHSDGDSHTIFLAAAKYKRMEEGLKICANEDTSWIACYTEAKEALKFDPLL